MPSLAPNLSITTTAFSLPHTAFDHSNFIILGLAFALGVLILGHFSPSGDKENFPLVTLDRHGDRASNFKQEWLNRAIEILEKGRNEHPEQPFRVLTDSGEMVILPPSMANIIHSVDELSFMETLRDRLHTSLPGFEPFKASTQSERLLQVVTRKQMTKYLNRVTRPLSEESSYAINLRFGTSAEWSEYQLYTEILDIVARASTRVFLGEDVCRNENWLNVTKNYTVRCFKAAARLRQKPQSLRFILHWFDPQCREVRNYVTLAKQIIAPVIRRRQKVRLEALARGEPLPSFNDAIDWFEDEAKGAPYDPEIMQLTLSLVAIHTTTDLVCEVMVQISRDPELFAELREEISRVLTTEGWNKTALYHLNLLDSVIKESQRLKPVSAVSQIRMATADVTLADGTFLPKGTRLACDAGLRLSPSYYPDPHRFNGRRFLAWRETPGKDAAARLVSTSPESMGFGHGQHACPGRFLADNEVKVILCHMLMKYDWKLAADCIPETQKRGLALNTDPKVRILVRRRVNEVDIDDLGACGV